MKGISETVQASKVVVEHLFDNHEYCDEKWCRPKLNARLKIRRRVVSHIINVKRVKNCILKSGRRINRSQYQLDSKRRFMNSIHRKNEAINTPKTKTYGMSILLTNRVMIAIGINNY